VFKHYGMTEMGLGGGVECSARKGYHLREADLLVEIVDPSSGLPLSDGNTGEVVFTTLTRDGMPLIRYRTGDIAAFRLDSCACATVLKTLGRIRGRRNAMLKMTRHGRRFFIGDLDEKIFSVDGVIDYRGWIDRQDNRTRLTLQIFPEQLHSLDTLKACVRIAVLRLSAIRSAVADGRLTVDIQLTDGSVAVTTGTAKRRIEHRRERNTCR
jgi:phenylacetate-coenzyme A ligase PaaK-like adenylate-forming protein